MRPTDFQSRFDGRRFHNVPDRAQAGGLHVTWWLMNRDLGPWDPADTPRETGDPPPRTVESDSARATFVNHSTVLLQLAGRNVLTDPIWSDRASPVPFAGPRRMHPPGIRFDDLPPIDTILLSHNHYDHLCLETLRRLHERDRPTIVTGLGNAPLLTRHGLGPVTELDWWQETGDVIRTTYVPAQHFSGRGLFDRNRALWGGFFLRWEGGSIYFAADSGAGPHFAAIRGRLGAPDFAMIPIGAFLPRTIMAPVHMSPAEAVEAHLEVGARRSMAIHFGTFPLADDGQWEPAEELARARAAKGLSPGEFMVPGFGEGVEIRTGR